MSSAKLRSLNQNFRLASDQVNSTVSPIIFHCLGNLSWATIIDQTHSHIPELDLDSILAAVLCHSATLQPLHHHWHHCVHYAFHISILSNRTAITIVFSLTHSHGQL